MEPTQGRSGGGNRPSAARRYGPLIAIIAIIAVVGIIVAVSSGGSDSNNKSDVSTGTGTNATAAGIPKQPWPIFTQANKDSVKWGPNCNTQLGTVKIPYDYASPCAKPFSGDNGGATADGVTGDSIKIVVYQGDPAKNPLQSATIKGAGADVSPATARTTYNGYFDLFQKYYNFYGRKLDVVYFPGTGAPDDAITAKADADAIADMHPFAVMSGPTQTPAWTDELAARHVMCVGNCSLAVPEKTIADNSQYLYGVGPTPEQAGLLTAKLVTEQLQGKKAIYGGSAVKDKTRVFGVAHYDTVDGQQRQAYATLKNALTAGGVKIAADLPFQLDLARGQENARTMIAKLKDAGVTTVVYTGDPLTPANLTKEATAQNYFPEWVIGSNVLVDIALFGRTYDQEQWQHAFGLALTQARVNQDANPAYTMYKWFNGVNPPNNTYGVILADLAQTMNGINMAGPKLSPDTFKAALYNAPVLGGTPLSPRTSRGKHGLWPGIDVGGSDDTGLIWWNPKAHGEDEVGKVGDGLYEYASMGKRWTLNDMPSQNPGLFDASKSITIFTSVPKQYQPPNYPSPAK
jgi:hypothetical protein